VKREEQETTVTYSAVDDVVQVYSANPKHVRRLVKDERVSILRGSEAEGYVFATIPVSDYDPLKGFKRRVNLSEERRRELSERMADLRNRQNG